MRLGKSKLNCNGYPQNVPSQRYHSNILGCRYSRHKMYMPHPTNSLSATKTLTSQSRLCEHNIATLPLQNPGLKTKQRTDCDESRANAFTTCAFFAFHLIQNHVCSSLLFWWLRHRQLATRRWHKLYKINHDEKKPRSGTRFCFLFQFFDSRSSHSKAFSRKLSASKVKQSVYKARRLHSKACMQFTQQSVCAAKHLHRKAFTGKCLHAKTFTHVQSKTSVFPTTSSRCFPENRCVFLSSARCFQKEGLARDACQIPRQMLPKRMLLKGEFRARHPDAAAFDV